MTSATLGPITAEDAVLRMLGEDDLALTRAWRNHDDSRFGFHSTDVITLEQHLAWYRDYTTREDDFVFILEADGRPVAQAALYDIVDGTAELGRVLVDPAARGEGLSHQVVGLCMRVADEILALDEVHLEVKRDNPRAIRAYERAGFVPDRDAVGRDDSLVMRRHRP